MTPPTRSRAFDEAWQAFLAVDARLEVIHGRHRASAADALSRGDPFPDLPLRDHMEVERLEAEVARLAAILEQSDPGVAGPLSTGISEKEIVQAYRLAGWSQWKIDRKLTGERYARLLRKLEAALRPHGVWSWAGASRDDIASLSIPAQDKHELLELDDELTRLGAETERLSEPPPRRPAPPAAQPNPRADERVRQWESKAEAVQEFDDALAELRQMLQSNPISDEQLDAQMRCAFEQAAAQHGLEVVSVATALKELRFRPQAPGSADLRWDGRQGKHSLLIGAGRASGTWHLTGWYRRDGQLAYKNTELGASAPRGSVALAILEMWRSAIGTSARPPGALDGGRIYEQQRGKLGRGDLSLPRMELDGPAFRVVRRRIRQRCGAARDLPATLSMADGRLTIEVSGSVYEVPAQGGMGMACTVSVADLIDIPPSCLRGRAIGVDRGLATLTLDWYCIKLR